MIKIGRPINGVTLNGLEHLLDENGHEMRFTDEAAASKFLKEKGYTDDMLENDGIVFSEIFEEAADKFYLERASDTLHWLCYNPDSRAGGQYVENVFDFELIRKAADAEDFFDHIGSCCQQYLIDVGTDDFADYDELFKTIPGDFEGRTEETKTALLATVNAVRADGRALITKVNIEIDRELLIEEGYINAYIAAWFDVDERFGTKTADTDDYVNVYANYTPDTDELEVGYTLIRADGANCDFVAVELADSERTAILEKLRDAGLDECIAEIQNDPDEDAGMTLS